MQQDTVFEWRDYTLRPGMREALIDLFEAEFIDSQNAVGAHVRGIFRDVDRPDHFVWLRGFADMTSRKRALTDFYSGPVWETFRDAANATMLDSDDVHLLTPCFVQNLDGGPHEGAMVVTEIYPDVHASQLAAAVQDVDGILAAFVTEVAENNFPALPVWRHKVAVVLRLSRHHGLPDILDGLPAPTSRMRLRPTAKSPIALRGAEQSVQDFDFLRGDWTVRNRKLKARLAGCTDWLEFTSKASFRTYLDGRANVDEFDYAEAGFKGMSVRTLDMKTDFWSIYWADSTRGCLTPPVHGGFIGNQGYFLGRDVEGGRPVLCRFKWKAGAAPRWEQAFSIDEGKSWEVNWVMEFSRK